MKPLAPLAAAQQHEAALRQLPLNRQLRRSLWCARLLAYEPKWATRWASRTDRDAEEIDLYLSIFGMAIELASYHIDDLLLAAILRMLSHAIPCQCWWTIDVETVDPPGHNVATSPLAANAPPVSAVAFGELALAA
jgi:hypothetical protein